MSLIDKVLSREEFVNHPPVLVDVGASGEVHSKWKKIARYSLCISFDADEREIGYLVRESKTYRKQYVYNCIVAEKKSESSDFYLTKSPFCSSALEPDVERLSDYAFVEKFEIERKVKLKTIDLPSVFNELKISKIDWFKTDSQGTDLRLFQSIGKEMIDKVIVAEFEPGFIDAYKGEDKLYMLLAYMDDKNFWIANINVLGSQRINRNTKYKKIKFIPNRLLKAVIRDSPGWAEIVFFNSFKQENLFDKRDYLLSWVFAVIQKQYGFALDIALKGKEMFNDPIFPKMENFAFNKIKLGILNIPSFYIRIIFKRIFSR
jgi:hypothetical protein